MEEKTKICFKCHRELPLSMFYEHPMMGDGHLNKCKDCTKEDVRKKYIEKSADNAYMEKERARGREKYRRLGYRNRQPTDNQIRKKMLYPELRVIKKKLHADVPQECELHHWNYRRINEVLVLERRLHSRVHTKINLNIDDGFYYLGEEPLDTIEKHLSVVKSVCEEFGFDYSKVRVLTKP